MSFEEMSPVFGEVTAEWSAPHDTPLEPFLFLAHGLPHDPNAFRVIVTDFTDNTFQVIKSREELEDMRDNIGIGGIWVEFVEYVIASLSSSDVKLILEGSSELGGASNAKLLAQKAKGMPRILISLRKLVGGSAGLAMAKLSRELYKDLKDVRRLLVEEQQNKHQLSKKVSSEQEKNDILEKQLDMLLHSKNHKMQKINGRDNSDSTSAIVSQDSPDKQSLHPSSTRVTNRVVPAHRRSKVRGVVLEDTEDDA